jgi:hypothetical protein
VHGVLRLREAIVRKLPFARRVDESHPAQVGEMTRHGRLWQAENVNDVANAKLARDEDAEDADTRRIGKALEDGVEVIDRRSGEFCGHWCQSFCFIIFANTSIICIGEYDYVNTSNYPILVVSMSE